MRSTERPRRVLPGILITLLSPFFRHSMGRDAYVLRGVGNRRGLVLKKP